MNCIYFILVHKYYIVDAGLRNTRGFLAPFIGMRYPLQDYRGSEREPKNEKEQSYLTIDMLL